jgi:hypothetical protein
MIACAQMQSRKIMRKIRYLDELHYDEDVEAERSDIAVLVAEICSRVKELREIDQKKCHRLLLLFPQLLRTSPTLFDAVIAILTGSGEHFKPYSKLAEEKKTSRQYQHQLRQKELRKIEEEIPALGAVLRSILRKNMPSSMKADRPSRSELSEKSEK